jgi:hypothetical protein
MLPLVIVALAAGAAYKVSTSKKGVMTDARRLIYNTALTKHDPPLPPDQLLALASEFDKNGLSTYGDVLRKRANLRNLPPALIAARKAAVKKALASKDPVGIRAMANALEAESAFGTAETLRQLADSLDSAEWIASITPPPSPPAPAPHVNTSPGEPTSMPVSQEHGSVQASSPESMTPSTAAASAGVAATPDNTPVQAPQPDASQMASVNDSTPIE